MSRSFDAIVIGSGFGGSVSALRLARKGYRVAVLEMGRRFEASDFPETNWDLPDYLWAPRVGCTGIQAITMLRDLLVLHGTGVGGGSLVYANTLLQPGERFFRDPAWDHLADWGPRLKPHYETAKRMLGAVKCPQEGRSDEVLREVARDMGREETFDRPTVGVFFGDEPGEMVPDPFFDGKGPDRAGCISCGGCMVGCRYHAKNTLDKNYLHLAERAGATIVPETKVVGIRPAPDGEGYELRTEKGTALGPGRRRRLWTADRVVCSAGVMGSVELLLRCKDEGWLPGLSDRLGTRVRTNSEALVGARSRDPDADFSEGIAIQAGFWPDDRTHVEACRYPEGSDAMSLLATHLVGGGPPWPRPLRFLGSLVRRPLSFLRHLNPLGWAKETIILLCMQDVDSRIRLTLDRPWWSPFGRTIDSVRGDDAPPTWLPVANEVAERVAETIDGEGESVLPEVLFDLSSTAHIMGGCPMGRDRAEGVIDHERNEVFGHPGLHVVDGSMIPANLGVNPSLTITALAEHAMANIAPKDA